MARSTAALDHAAAAAGWLLRYLGVPFVPLGRGFDGADCWGLALLILAGELGQHPPEPEAVYASCDPRCPDIAGYVADTLAGAWASTAPETPFAVHLFDCAGGPAHVGVSLGGRDFVHTRALVGVHVSNLDRASHGETRWEPRRRGSYAFVG